MPEADVTLITGARKGIGQFLVQHYLAQGHRVIGCSREPSAFSHARYEHHVADVADEKTVGHMFMSIRKAGGRLTHLINNAGIASMNHSMLTPMSTVQRLMNTNFIGTFLCSREAAKLMQPGRYGRIVNLVSVAVPLQLEGEAVYAASKAAVVSLTQILARELASFGITVNSVGPTPVETDLIRSVPKPKIEALLARQAIPRFCQFDDIANVIDFYLRKESGYVTGQTLYLGGVSA